MTAEGTQPQADAWKDIPWKSYEKNVFRLQKRIYRASSRGAVKAVHKLQRLLRASWASRCLAVRRVTQDNQGKKTPGVDGVKALPPPQRLALAQDLRHHRRPKPTRRLWIPKPGTEEKRPLGIPTIGDRAEQALIKMVLEPEWEAKFEPNSYGFRPGRSAHDAIMAIHIGTMFKPKYVLDADIAKCFDRINHQALLNKLNTTPSIRRIIKGWLKAGVMEGGEIFPTQEGTPQGGVVSPLLANVALHGLEEAITTAFPKQHRSAGEQGKPIVVRYADDFVVMHSQREAIDRAKQLAEAWLKPMGLELKPSKTRIVHTLHQAGNQPPGFDFLGFNIRQHLVGKTHETKVGRTRKGTGLKSKITPTKEAMQRHLKAIKATVTSHKAAPQESLIDHLNPIIRGWTNYYSAVESSATFDQLDTLTFRKLYSWARRRHPNKNRQWVASRYWRKSGRKRWQFATEGGVKLYNHTATHFQKHVKIQGARSPYDGNWVYWASRLGRHTELPTRVAKLLNRQKGKCTYCGLYFRCEDLPEIDHIEPKSQGGQDRYTNWQLLHRHCHDAKTAEDIRRLRGAHDKGLTDEEPYEAKVSRTVLETSRLGD